MHDPGATRSSPVGRGTRGVLTIAEALPGNCPRDAVATSHLARRCSIPLGRYI